MLTKEQTYYGEFGGIFLPESLIKATEELSVAFKLCQADLKFMNEFNELLIHYVGRQTPLTEVAHFQQACQGPRVFLKREDLTHTGAHKINNALGQCLLAKKMGKTRIIAETGAGQHGVATATASAYLGLECDVYMGTKDMQRQRPNVEKMQLLGAKVMAVDTGAQTLKDAVNAALRDYAASFEYSHYCLGSALGPYPYPQMVRFFQSVIGRETKQQCLEQVGRLPNKLIACVGGGSNAIGIFSAFIDDKSVELIGVEAGGNGNQLGEHAARFQGGKPGVLHGCYSYLLQDPAGQVMPTHSISAGLDYPMVGPEHAYLHDIKRAYYTAITDQDALVAFKLLAKTEGIIPALESSHALAYYMNEAKHWDKNTIIIINLSGRGDKDLPELRNKGLL